MFHALIRMEIRFHYRRLKKFWINSTDHFCLFLTVNTILLYKVELSDLEKRYTILMKSYIIHTS